MQGSMSSGPQHLAQAQSYCNNDVKLTEVESGPEEQSDGEPERSEASCKACWA